MVISRLSSSVIVNDIVVFCICGLKWNYFELKCRIFDKRYNIRHLGKVSTNTRKLCEVHQYYEFLIPSYNSYMTQDTVCNQNTGFYYIQIRRNL